MSIPYPTLLSPLKVRNFTLKNRMESSNSQLHFIQGPENYPSSATIEHFIQRARDGAAIVTISGINDMIGSPPLPPDVDISHFPGYDVYDPKCQNYIMQLIDAVHYYDSLLSVGLFSGSGAFPYFNEQGKLEIIHARPNMDEMKAKPGENNVLIGVVDDTLSADTLHKLALSFAQQAAFVKKLGADMVTLHMCYRGQILGQFISPLTNQRTDEFNGSLENRARFPLMVFQEIRKAVGENFLIEVELSGEEPEGGLTTEEAIAFLRMAEPYIDIVQVRAGEADPNHTTGFSLEKTPYLPLAEKIKKSGVDVLVSNTGGWFHPDWAEQALKEGKLDLIGMARAWISNPNYGQLVYEGRQDDLVPCLRCNKCHGRGRKDTLVSVCSVNPLIGLDHFKDTLVLPPQRKKRVAVVGGGPGGLRTALFLHDRGHQVTIFEQSHTLGGLIRHADHVNFKWPLREYKDYLIRQIDKRGIAVRLDTKATPEMLRGKYDAVVVAVGSHPRKPPIPGIDRAHVCFAVDALMAEETVGKKVVVIGGGEVGVETGMYLAQTGHDVTVLEMQDLLAADTTMIHYRTMFESAWEALPNFRGIVNATATGIGENSVTYRDQEGVEHTLPADTVVISAGMIANRDEALAFYGCADRFYMVGDCRNPGTIQSTNRSAFATASII